MSEKFSKTELSLNTILAGESHSLPSEKPHSLPIYSTSSYDVGSLENSVSLFDGEKKGYVYSRYGNPTVEALEEKIAWIECGDNSGKAVMTSSGMSAISIVLFSILEKGDICLTHDGLYGGSTEVLELLSEKIGFKIIYADLNDIDYLEKIQQQNPIKLIYFESPSNPLLRCIGIKSLADFAMKHQIVTVCDNTICTALLQTPLQSGIDFSVYSTTKYLSGHGNSIAGCIVSKHNVLMDDKIRKNMRLIGANCSPWEAWLTYNGMKTLALRLERQCSNANHIAQFLENHPAVQIVHHNSLESHIHHSIALEQMKDFAPLMSFELKNGLDGVSNFLSNIKIIRHAPTLGDLDTLVLHPYSSSHRNIPTEIKTKLGIRPGLIRLSTGIENIEDLNNDLERGLNS